MSALTESEIFDYLDTTFGEAAALCESLVLNRRKPAYRKLGIALQGLQGACRQAGHWRENHEWFTYSEQIQYVRDRAGDWMRGYFPRENFFMLAEALKRMRAQAKLKKDRPHGRLGQILPEPPAAFRDTRPVQVPAGALLQ